MRVDELATPDDSEILRLSTCSTLDVRGIMAGVAHEGHALVPRGEALVIGQSEQIGVEDHARESVIAQVGPVAAECRAKASRTGVARREVRWLL